MIIFEICLFDDLLDMAAKKLSFFFGEISGIDGLAVLQHYMCFFDAGKLILKDGGGMIDGNGYNGAAGFFCNLETSFVEREEGVFFLVSGAFRENTDRNSGLYFFYGFQDGLQSLLDIAPVQEETVKIFHPVGQKRIAEHFFLGNIAGRPGYTGIGKQNIKIAPMIGYI